MFPKNNITWLKKMTKHISSVTGQRGSQHDQQHNSYNANAVGKYFTIEDNWHLLLEGSSITIHLAVWYKTKSGSQNFGYQIWCLFCYNMNLMKKCDNNLWFSDSTWLRCECWKIWRATNCGSFLRKLTSMAGTNWFIKVWAPMSSVKCHKPLDVKLH